MPKKYEPQFLLDEQMLFSDAKTSLAYQIREEVKETNRLLRKLVEKETIVGPETSKVTIEKKNK